MSRYIPSHRGFMKGPRIPIVLVKERLVHPHELPLFGMVSAIDESVIHHDRIADTLLFPGRVFYCDGLPEIPHRFLPVSMEEVPHLAPVFHLQSLGIEEVE